MIITLVRHAEVQQEYHNCYNGHIDIDLSEYGRVQAKNLARNIDVSHFDAVYSSDLIRCRETLKYFREDIDVVYTSLLREKSWGRHEGLSFEQIVARENIEYKNFTQWIETLDGEDYRDFRRKIEYFVLSYLPKTSHKNILIITHSGVIKSLISLIQKVTLEQSFKVNTPYAGVVVFDTLKQTFCFEFDHSQK